ncbi:MAG: diiron oxygenase, partial [Candidatus Methylomirabilis sp.]|nr:diiron oxygenase [Deltaproteobacteria bacterium]
RISQIHVTEEARHLAFARQFLRRRVPALSPTKKVRLAIAAPLILGRMARMMMQPSGAVIRRWAIPESVIAEAYTHNYETRKRRLAATEKVRALCVELGIATPASRRLWGAWGLWPSERESAEFGFRIA